MLGASMQIVFKDSPSIQLQICMHASY